MKLIELYEAAVLRADIRDDPLQRQVIPELQRVVDELRLPSHRWFGLRRTNPVMGLYLHGPVGVGKTYLMDLLYQFVDEQQKARFHFHHFMQQIDAELRQRQGEKNQVRAIAKRLAEQYRLLCLDEFLVHDVADAMILAELLNGLFAHRVVLVATANTRVDDLYLNGVHRERFLPAIGLIKQHCHVFFLTEPCDYRLGRACLQQAYCFPLNEESAHSLLEQFLAITTKTNDAIELMIQHRPIAIVRCTDEAVWFQFDVICNVPRCQLDYLEIADRFNTVFLSHIPALTEMDTVRVLLLIHFVDVMYDRGIRLVISAAVPVEGLYVTGPMLKTFERTRSRLVEMQSMDYLQRHERRSVQSL